MYQRTEGEADGATSWRGTPVFDPANPTEDLGQKREVADLLVQAGLTRFDANTLAILGGLPDMDGLPCDLPCCP